MTQLRHHTQIPATKLHSLQRHRGRAFAQRHQLILTLHLGVPQQPARARLELPALAHRPLDAVAIEKGTVFAVRSGPTPAPAR